MTSGTGETGFVHEVVLRHLREEKLTGAIDAYACGPTPMIDAVLPVLQMNGVEPDHIYFDKFTPAVRWTAFKVRRRERIAKGS